MSLAFSSNTNPLDILSDMSVVDIRMIGNETEWTVAVKPWQGARMAENLRRIASAIEAEVSARTH